MAVFRFGIWHTAGDWEKRWPCVRFKGHRAFKLFGAYRSSLPSSLFRGFFLGRFFLGRFFLGRFLFHGFFLGCFFLLPGSAACHFRPGDIAVLVDEIEVTRFFFDSNFRYFLCHCSSPPFGVRVNEFRLQHLMLCEFSTRKPDFASFLAAIMCGVKRKIEKNRFFSRQVEVQFLVGWRCWV